MEVQRLNLAILLPMSVTLPHGSSATDAVFTTL